MTNCPTCHQPVDEYITHVTMRDCLQAHTLAIAAMHETFTVHLEQHGSEHQGPAKTARDILEMKIIETQLALENAMKEIRETIESHVKLHEALK